MCVTQHHWINFTASNTILSTLLDQTDFPEPRARPANPMKAIAWADQRATTWKPAQIEALMFSLPGGTTIAWTQPLASQGRAPFLPSIFHGGPGMEVLRQIVD